MVGLARAKNVEEVKNLMASPRGPELRRALAGLIEAFKRNENKLLIERTWNSQADFEYSIWVVTLSLVLSFALLLFVMHHLRAEIARRQEAEHNLRESKVRAEEGSLLKSRFLANMSHEFRTPLNGIIGMARMLEETDLSSKQKGLLSTLKISSSALLALINQVLDISKIESGKLQLEEAPFELKSLIASTLSVVEYAAAAKRLELRWTVAADVPDFFLGDALRLRQVLLNLLNNAVKFSDRGTIELAVINRNTSDSSVTLHIEVRDQGVGLNEDARKHLFQSFAQGDSSTSRKYGGTGLGLAISRQIVEMMGGSIDFESTLGAGSRFFSK